MNELVELAEPSLMRNSLILTGLTFRTLAVVVSDCLTPVARFVHWARPTMSPLKGVGPDVTLNVALTVAPGGTLRAGAPVFLTEVHPLGTEMLNSRSAAGAP